VSAEDKGTGNKNNIVIINNQNGLSPEDIDLMVNDAKRFADKDRKAKERAEARNGLAGYACSEKNQTSNIEPGMGCTFGKFDKYVCYSPYNVLRD